MQQNVRASLITHYGEQNARRWSGAVVIGAMLISSNIEKAPEQRGTP